MDAPDDDTCTMDPNDHKETNTTQVATTENLSEHNGQPLASAEPNSSMSFEDSKTEEQQASLGANTDQQLAKQEQQKSNDEQVIINTCEMETNSNVKQQEVEAKQEEACIQVPPSSVQEQEYVEQGDVKTMEQNKKPSNSMEPETIPKKVTRQSAAKLKGNTSRNDPKVIPGSLQEYRQRVLHLERIYLNKLYEAERAKLYHSQIAKINCEYDCQLAEEEYELGRRLLITRLLYENSDRRRRIEELKYKIVRDDNNSFSRLRRHGAGHRTRSTLNPMNTNNDMTKNSLKDISDSAENEVSFFPSQLSTEDAQTTKVSVSARWNRFSKVPKRGMNEKSQLRVLLDSDELKEDLAEIGGTQSGGKGIESSVREDAEERQEEEEEHFRIDSIQADKLKEQTLEEGSDKSKVDE
eukprot:jgi/Galph1/2736/GphlegSOOS_G1424.1